MHIVIKDRFGDVVKVVSFVDGATFEVKEKVPRMLYGVPREVVQFSHRNMQAIADETTPWTGAR